MKRRTLLCVILACASCTQSASVAPSPSPPSTTASCYPTPPAGPSSFSMTITPDPVWVAVGFRAGQLDGPLVPSEAPREVTVRATGSVFGSVNRIDRVLRDRETGALLGEQAYIGPFFIAGGTPCRGVDPLLAYGVQKLGFGDDLGFVGRPAT